MSDRLPPRVSADDETARPADGVGAGMPRWVKVFTVVSLMLLVLFVALHLTGRSLGGHMPSSGHHMHMSEPVKE